MIRTITLSIFFCFFILICISGCAYDNKEELYPPKASDTGMVSYSATIKPMLDAHCSTSGCHEPGAQLPDLTVYQNVFNNKDEIKRRAVEPTSDPMVAMPSAGQMGASDRDKLGRWIDQGALNN
jgi:hypothetical protein